MKFNIKILFKFFALMFFISSALYGQNQGKIAGVITDANSGEAIPGVNILIQGTNLGASSDIDGYYYIINVPAGKYDVEAVYIGYKSITQTGVMVSVDRTTELNFKMEESFLEGEAVVVVAQRDLLHKEISSSQQVMTSTQIENAAGVTTINEFLGQQAGISDERTLTIRGGSAEQTGTLINGLSFVNQRIGKAEASVPISALEQVSIESGGYSAEFGNFRSGIINMTTKSGDKDSYHITFDYQQNVPGMKRFGASLYDPNNYFLRPYLDPVLAFKGTSDETWAEVLGVSPEEGAYQNDQHANYRGLEFLTPRYNRTQDENHQASEMDLYLWNAWMQMATPDFDKLEELYPELTTENPEYSDPSHPFYRSWDEIKSAVSKHAHKKEGANTDYNIDFGLGGPVPLFHKELGDATFYLSHKTTYFDYMEPVVRDGEKTSVTMLTVKSELSNNMTLKLNGIYRFIQGSQVNFPSNGDIADINLGGDTMPINNLSALNGSSPNGGGLSYVNGDYVGRAYGGNMDQYAYHPTFFQPKDQSAYLTGLTINNVVNKETYWDLTLSYGYQKDFFEPKETRDSTPLINFGPIWMDERPYGVNFGPDTVFYNPSDPSEFFTNGEYEEPYGNPRRFASKTGQFHENSVTQQLRAKFDLSSQFNRHNFVKTGVELNYFDMDNNTWSWWQGHDTNYEMRDRRTPYQLGAYVQDQISLESLEARIGVRFDYYNSGGGVWPTGDPFNADAFTAGTEADNEPQLFSDLSSGKTVVWDRWRAIDKAMGGTFLEKTKNYFTVSPRIGVAFPISERSKFWFNYGHFRQVLPYSQQFMYKMRFYKQGIFQLGNPNLEPPRTISYELGLSYNLLDSYLIEVSTYYKDVSGESARVRNVSSDNLVTYDSWLNNRWEDDQGFELRITKNVGTYFTGWLNFWYVIDKNGRVGAETYNQDINQNTVDTYYGGDENTPTLTPKIAANLSFHTPMEFGPETGGFFPLGGWTLNLLPVWEQGSEFTFNPGGIRNVSNNLRWPDYYKMDLKLSKAFQVAGVSASLYLDVRNVFNTKINWMKSLFPFTNLDDYNQYLASLHLPQYKDKSIYPEEYVAGNDEIGDLRSDKKPYINDPNIPMFLYGYPREIWFGLRFNL